MDLRGPRGPKWFITLSITQIVAISGHELDKVAVENITSPTIKCKVDVAVQVSGGKLVPLHAQDAL